MQTILAFVEYDGSRYAGFQIQKNSNTIQAEIEKALKKLFKKQIRIAPSGRTDSGVHALAHPFHFQIETKLSLSSIQKALNSFLPNDICINRVVKKPNGFHARFSAKKKRYDYHIHQSTLRAPLLTRSVQIKYALDITRMKKALKFIEGRHDFRSFAAKTPKDKDTVREIYKTSLKKKGRELIFSFEGNGFLYNMVRNLVGTVLEVGRGKMTLTEFKRVLRAKNRNLAGPTAPAKGLRLIKVTY